MLGFESDIMDYRFQVNLTGIIDLLSKHTYSSPQVFIRELLQNASDAIVARNVSGAEVFRAPMTD